jgi:hypothetical protein
MLYALFMIAVFPHMPGSPLACMQHGRTCSTPSQDHWLAGFFISVVLLLAFACSRKVKGIPDPVRSPAAKTGMRLVYAFLALVIVAVIVTHHHDAASQHAVSQPRATVTTVSEHRQGGRP